MYDVVVGCLWNAAIIARLKQEVGIATGEKA